jgi:4-carboxymuconolactone decarboxylase
MTADGVTLGGRLPLYNREALEPAHKELFDWLMNKAVPWAEGAGFQAGIEAGQLIGPFNPACRASFGLLSRSASGWACRRRPT